MARKSLASKPLTFVEIVMRSDAETIKAAYEARLQVDTLLKEREEAYRRIADLESQVETIMGEPGVFVFPEPPLPVAGIAAKKPSPARKKPAASMATNQASKKEPAGNQVTDKPDA